MPISTHEFRSKVIGKIKKKIDVIEIKGKRDHYRFQFWYNCKKILLTHCSLGSGGNDIGDDLLGKIKRQLRLDNVQQIYNLKLCPMTAEDYLDLLKQKNVISN